MVCDEDGRCWRERGERRVIIREPRRSHTDMLLVSVISSAGVTAEELGGGIGFRAPGVSVGISTDRY